jgi:hypothetical protein
MEILLFALLIFSFLLVYSTYKLYTLLKAEKIVTKGLQSALSAILTERSEKTISRNKK